MVFARDYINKSLYGNKLAAILLSYSACGVKLISIAIYLYLIFIQILNQVHKDDIYANY